MRGYSHGHPLFLPPREIARNHPIPELLDKRLVFVTGKGGVGKTTVAVALGLRAAAEGKRTIVCEVSSQENASRIFDHTEVGFHEVEMEENLWSISIDPDESMREYVLLQLKVRAMRDMLFRSRIFNYLAAATPGLKELVTIGKIWELAQLDRKVKSGRKYDLVIVDAPATGHGIGFLQTPRTFAAIARVGPIHSQAQQLDRLITDHEHTGTAIVALPEEMPVNESAALERDLRDEVGVAVDRIYLNGLYPERFSKEEAERLAELAEGEDGAVRAAARAALSEHGRARSQRAQLARLRRRVEAPVKTLPFLFEPELGVEAARQLAQEARLMPSVGEILEGKDICICAGSGGVGKTTTSAAIATGMAARGLKVCVLTIDPAKRLADSLGLKELGNEARRVDPALFEQQGDRDEGRAVGDDARRQGDLRRAGRPPGARRGVARPRPRTTASTSRSPAPSPARRSTWRWRSCSSCTPKARFDLLVLDTPPTRNALDFLDAPKRLTQFIEGRSLRVFMKPTGLAAKVAGRGASVALASSSGSSASTCSPTWPSSSTPSAAWSTASRPGPSGSTSCSPTPAPASSSSAARRASRSTRPSTSTASWSRRSCPSAASSSTRSTTRPSELRGDGDDLPAALAEKLGDEDLAAAGRRRTSPTTRRWPSATPATSSTSPRSCAPRA